MNRIERNTVSTPFATATVITASTRSQALAEGVLKDASVTAREAGIKWPVAMTAAAWAEAVAWDNINIAYQGEAGRLWDVVFMASMKLRQGAGVSNRLAYKIVRIPNKFAAETATELELVMVAGPGDDGQPVITIMLPHED